ncbi:L,D-transpeptidase [Prosthecobacter sp.]|uniref:L,D-transpeptidase n=1 Tax=Prosthecobacter sp. TaxID=1965333 RepID=UPI002ABCD584|nr:L,D-transpeptidase [Prosthecobacter sp.]MDZ4404020.1 L,D-transpeptidase [Prosthecobacter sp.]
MSTTATLSAILLLPAVLGLASCCGSRCQKAPVVEKETPPQRLVVSIPDQKMLTFEGEKMKRRYPVSTSRFGVGDKPHSNLTPLGRLEVVGIIGQGLPKGMRLYSREPTGEILKPNTTIGDAIVTRIVRLRGTEPCNARTFQRCIYIHGTTDEKGLRKPVSWGCVRMGSSDIIHLCRWVKPGAEVDIVEEPLPPTKFQATVGRLFHWGSVAEQ